MDKSNLDINSALEAAWLKLLDIFPFNNYIRNPRKVGYFFMVKKVAERSARNANVLDFGSGPCDKTALFSLVGMNVTAIDDMQDVWHKIEDNKKKILNFANTVGINYIVSNNLKNLSLPKEHFDVLMSHDVLEHLHSSPRVLLNNLLQYVKPNGIMVITVPNAANLRKRIHLLLGKTNYNKYNYYYWYPGLWRGHVREYVRQDLVLLNKFLGLELLELDTYHLQLDVLPSFTRPFFKLFSKMFPGFRDSWMLISRKPVDWKPNIKPDPTQFEEAFGSQYFQYSSSELNWDE